MKIALDSLKNYESRLKGITPLVDKTVADGLVDIGKQFTTTLTAERLTGGGDSHDLLNVRTGSLRRSLMFEVDRGNLRLRLSIGGGGAPYARTHEGVGDGPDKSPMTIKAKAGKALAIPVGKALTASGVPRYTTPRDVPGLRMLVPKRGGPPLLVKSRGKKRSGIDVMFVLKKSVTIPPRLRFEKTFREHQGEYIDQLTNGLINKIKGAAA